MTYPILQDYLKQLKGKNRPEDKLWIDEQERVQGRFKNCSLTSIFNAIVDVKAQDVFGFDAFSHSYNPTDNGLSVWHLLMNGATDHESVELDRLTRSIHVINFFRQPITDNSTLVIDVHDRLIAAVGSNHGAAFRRIVSSLGIPQESIILQLPGAKSSQNWALSQVIDNYRVNNFFVATRAYSIADAIFQVNLFQPTLIRLDITKVDTGDKLKELISATQDKSTKILFSRIEHPHELSLIRDTFAKDNICTKRFLVQGPLIATPQWDLTKGIQFETDLSNVSREKNNSHPLLAT